MLGIAAMLYLIHDFYGLAVPAVIRFGCHAVTSVATVCIVGVVFDDCEQLRRQLYYAFAFGS